MTSVRRKRSTSRRGRLPQVPPRRSPSPHHLERCYERGHGDGLCQGAYDQGKLDGYDQGRRAHWHGEDDDENGEKPSWRAIRQGRNDDSGSSSSSEDSENSTSDASSEFENSEDEGDDKRTREQIYEEIAQLENELAELEASDQEDRPHPTDG